MGNAIRSQTLAVAELVDNAIAAHGSVPRPDTGAGKLKVTLRFSKDPDSQVASLQVRDNATGMTRTQVSEELFFYMNKKTDSKTLNEFGVGAKDALARLAGDLGTISLRTIAIENGEKIATTIRKKSLRDIYSDGIKADSETAGGDEGVGTVWTIHSIKGGIAVPAQAAMFNALGSMYRQPIRDGLLQIVGYDELDVYYEAAYVEPQLLFSYPVSKNSEIVHTDQQKKEWKTLVDFTVQLAPSLGVPGNALKVSGWVGALQEMSANNYAGYSLIRRGRVVYMGPKERWAPDPPFSGGGSALDKRLTGELYCDEIPTTQSKADANVQFSEPLAEALVKHLNDIDPGGVLHQATQYVKKYYQSFLQSQGGAIVSEQTSNNSVAAKSGSSAPIAEELRSAQNEVDPTGDVGSKPSMVPYRYGTFLHPHTGAYVELLIAAATPGISAESKWSSVNGRSTVEVQASKLLHATLQASSVDENAKLALKALVVIAIVESMEPERGKQIRSVFQNISIEQS